MTVKTLHQTLRGCQDSPTRVRFIPELNLAALNQKRDKEYLIWCLLRTLNITGSGYIDYDPTISALANFYCRRTLFRILRAGEGIFWHRYSNGRMGRSRIEIKGIKAIAEYLGAFNLSRYVEIDAADIPQGLQARRALLYNTGAYKPWGVRHNPISRQSLEEKSGINERQQRRYDTAADTTRFETEAKYRDPQTFKLRSLKQRIILKNDSYEIKRQLGNLYFSKASKAPKGQLKKISKAIRGQNGSFLMAEASPKPSKRYWASFRDFLRSYFRGKASEEGCFYPTKSNELVYVQCLI